MLQLKSRPKISRSTKTSTPTLATLELSRALDRANSNSLRAPLPYMAECETKRMAKRYSLSATATLYTSESSKVSKTRKERTIRPQSTLLIQ